MLVLPSGYNRNNDPQGQRITEVIFEKAYPKLWQNVLSCHYWIERQ